MAMKDEVKNVEGVIVQGVKASESAVSKELAALHVKIDAWFVKHFHGNKIAEDTDNYNICHRAKEELKRLLADIGL